MHYIRALRPPNIAEKGSRGGCLLLGLVLTITSDLGESFLCPESPVELEATLLLPADTTGRANGAELVEGAPQQTECFLRSPVENGKKPALLRWTAGSRVLKTVVQCPPSVKTPRQIGGARLCIRTKDPKLSAASLPAIWADEARGLVMPLFVELRAENPEDTMALRRMQISSNQEGRYLGKTKRRRPAVVEIEEEPGESIARHIWDSGVLTTAMFAEMASGSPRIKGRFGELEDILFRTEKKPNVVEIGCGVGILGIGLATVLQHHYDLSASDDDVSPSFEQQKAFILMTDLPDAQRQVDANIAIFNKTAALSNETEKSSEESSGEVDEGSAEAPSSEPPPAEPSVEVYYENLDWEEGCKGVLGPKISSRAWDLIMLSDCTYNDLLPALVGTITEVHKLSSRGGCGGPKVLLTTKCRHPSEREIFSLMANKGWQQIKSYVRPLPHLGADKEEFEVYLWERR